MRLKIAFLLQGLPQLCLSEARTTQLALSKQPLVGQSLCHQWLSFKIYSETLPLLCPPNLNYYVVNFAESQLGPYLERPTHNCTPKHRKYPPLLFSL